MIRTKYEIADALRRTCPDRWGPRHRGSAVEADMVQDVLNAVAEDLELAARDTKSYWDAGANLRAVASALKTSDRCGKKNYGRKIA